MRFSAPVKKHWLGSFSIVLPPSGLRGFVPVVRDRWLGAGAARRKGSRGQEGGGGDHVWGGGGGGVADRDPRPYMGPLLGLCFHE